MTNINCSKNCIYQKDGKCEYSCVSLSNICINDSCAYFISNGQNKHGTN